MIKYMLAIMPKRRIIPSKINNPNDNLGHVMHGVLDIVGVSEGKGEAKGVKVIELVNVGVCDIDGVATGVFKGDLVGVGNID